MQPHKQSKPDSKAPCFRCDKTGHEPKDCRYRESTCSYCRIKGHLETACRKKKKANATAEKKWGSPKSGGTKAGVNRIHAVTRKNPDEIPELQLPLKLNGTHTVNFEVDTGAGDNFLGREAWASLGQPELTGSDRKFESASQHSLPILGSVQLEAQVASSGSLTQQGTVLDLQVADISDLNLLGRSGIAALGISVDALLANGNPSTLPQTQGVHTIFQDLKPNMELQTACRKLCDDFPDLFKPELGTLKDMELEVKFKSEAQPAFRKPRPVPFALQDDLAQAYEAGIKRGVWRRAQFNDYGTPVVPVRKSAKPGQDKASLRVCGDYATTVNAQLETHRYPMPSPEHLIQRLSGGCYFTKIDLADAYNQIPLGPVSQKRLALSTHQGVLLQQRLPFGISSAPGYFQEIMDQLTRDLPGVAVYMDDILVSGTSPQDHLNNLRRLLQRLHEKGLRCRLEKCTFAQPYVEYLGHLLSREGIAKGTKADAVGKMPAPSNVSKLRSFLGSIQFYSKFLPSLATTLEPLHRLIKKGATWNWGAREQDAFDKVKDALTSDTVLVHFDASLPLGISCDASEFGIGAVLFHRYPDGTERPIFNVSKTLTATQRNYSQIQREALAIVFALMKFHHFLYGRKFILVTDHKPLLALFGPNKAIPALAANRLARWALMLTQYEYTVEYRKSSHHGNADALSRNPVGPDAVFDTAESSADSDTVCSVKMISRQLSPTDPGVVRKETAKDPVLSAVVRYAREGWPQGPSTDTTTVEDSHMQTVQLFKKLKDSLSVTNGCLFYGSRLVIPTSLQPQVLEILHLGHFGIQRMKQLARTAVYWPGVDAAIVRMSQDCLSCAEHQNKPTKAPIHPWMVPEKPWSRIHVDHAINFMGSHWLVAVDAYSKYPCIHPTTSTSSKATMELLEQDFAHFGYPHTIVTDNATTFTSEEFQDWCRRRGITHLSGAPYHPETNGAAERLVQSMKNAFKKAQSNPKAALQEFLMQYRRTPLPCGYSPSELLQGRQIRARIDVLIPTPTQLLQAQINRQPDKAQRVASEKVNYSAGTPCYALYFGTRRDKDPRWVPAVVTKRLGPRTVNVRVFPTGPTWRRHIDQLLPRHTSEEDYEVATTVSAGTGDSLEPSTSMRNSK